MIQVIIFIVSVALTNIWASCTENTGFRHDVVLQTTCGIGSNVGTGCTLETAGVTASPLQGCGGKCITPYACAQNSILEITGVEYKCYQYSSLVDYTYKLTKCDTKCEADSVSNYASCLATQGGHWNSDSCKCVFDEVKDSVYYVCDDVISSSGSVVSHLYAVHIHFVNGVPQSVCGVNPSLTSGEGYKRYCPSSQKTGTCQQNGGDNIPPVGCSGLTCAEYPSDKMWPTAQCYAIVGATCYMRDLNSGNTFSCVCDGSCDYAYKEMFKGAQGTCKNPYKKPESSNSQPSSSNSQPPTSSGDPQSSAVEPPLQSSSSERPTSGASGESRDYTEQLNQIIANTQATMNNTGDISQWTQTTMNNTIDIKNEVSNIGIDVNNIRQNTGSIDNKLSTTNSLLSELNNKEWSVEVNVAGDTNIINVSGDTAKAPKEILGLLESSMSGEQNPDDTAGSGGTFDRLWGAVEALTGDTTEYKKVGDSVGHAVNGLYEKGFGSIRDTLGNSAIADSMGVWSEKLTNNGVISGNGSDQCPSVLTKTWNVQFPFGITSVPVTIGPLGVYLCNEVAGMGITFWSLCRVIIRAIVAIGCMMWLYRSVLGIDGGSNEED